MAFHLLCPPARESRATGQGVLAAGAGEPEGVCWAAGGVCAGGWQLAPCAPQLSYKIAPCIFNRAGLLPGWRGAARPGGVRWSWFHLAAANDLRLSCGLAGARPASGSLAGLASPGGASRRFVYAFRI